MEYYEFHYLMKDLVEFIKNKNNSESVQNEQSSNMMGNMKMPNMKMPNMKMPKL